MEMKEQRSYVITELNRLIKIAPESAESTLTADELQEIDWSIDNIECSRKSSLYGEDRINRMRGLTGQRNALVAKKLAALDTVTIAIPNGITYTLKNEKAALQEFLKRIEKGFTFHWNTGRGEESHRIPAFPSKHRTPVDWSKKLQPKQLPFSSMPKIPAEPVTDLNQVRKIAEAFVFVGNDPTKEKINSVYYNEETQTVVATDGRVLFTMQQPDGATWRPWEAGAPDFPQGYKEIATLPKTHTTTANTLDVLRKVKEASIMVEDYLYGVSLYLGDCGEVAIAAKYGTDEYRDGATVRSDGLIATCNCKILQDTFEAMAKLGYAQVTIRWNDEGSPIAISAGTVQVVIMPMR